MGAAIGRPPVAETKPLGRSPTPLQCLDVVRAAGRQLWESKDFRDQPNARDASDAARWACSVLPYPAGYLGPGPCVAPLPGLTVPTPVVLGSVIGPVVPLPLTVPPALT
mgnify:CR=1 FL=1